ncbi:hypothetical protein [Halapricum desulfuricans]|uniref:hypothetical protein n=1 Tax=Halapricum desulfuricans TaxID=2841257 RepID=UPI001E620837|nr:hypothetical protein [Halapricum desulfuricans]
MTAKNQQEIIPQTWSGDVRTPAGRQLLLGYSNNKINTDEVTIRAYPSGSEVSPRLPDSRYINFRIAPDDEEVVVIVTVDGESGIVARTELDTAGCKFVKIFATPGWRIPSVCYSRQYE